jgi:hypothetical protein
MLPKSGGHVNQQRVGALVKPKSITLRMSQRIGQAPGAGPERDPTKRAGWAQHAPGESWAAARYDKPGGPFDPHTGTQYVYSQIADGSYKRLTREVAVPAAGRFTPAYWAQGLTAVGFVAASLALTSRSSAGRSLCGS